MSAPEPTLEQAVEQFLAQRRVGAQVDVESFVQRFPALGRELREALESLVALESAHAERHPAHPAQLGPFEIEREIGRGGMGVVLEAREQPLGRRVALKLLPPELLASSSARARFQREATLAARLDHPGICTVFGAGVTDDQPWIAMRRVEGETLAQRIAASRERGELGVALPGMREGSRPLAIAACIARVARALAAAHAQGVLHRDVKSSNVMVTPSGEPVLLDFGLASAAEPDPSHLTLTGETAGTPAYLAPELISGELARSDAQCDVYSLGVTLYECLALERPFGGPTREALYRAVLEGGELDLRRANRDVPRDLAVIVSTALERDRSRRYASAAQFAADLEAVAAHRPIAARPISATGRCVRWAKREPRQALLASALAAAALGLALTGGILLASRDEVRAAELARRMRETEAGIVEGFALLNAGEFERGDAAFARILAREQGNLEALAGRAFALVRLARHAQALELLAAAPHTPAVALLRSLAAGEPPLDQTAWLATASPFDLFVEAEILRGEAYRRPTSEQAEWLRKALARSNELVARAPHARALYHAQRAYAALGARDEAAARSASAALLSLWPDSAREVFTAAQTLAGFDAAAARPLLERAAAMAPSFAPAFQNLGLVCLELNDFDGAKRALARALELHPQDPNAQNALGIVANREGCVDEARALWHGAVALAPDDDTIWGNLGDLEWRAGNYREAEHALAKALELDPHAPMKRARWAESLYSQGELELTRQQYEILVAVAPEDVRFWQRWATTLIELERPEEALDALEAARKWHAESTQLDALAEWARSVLDNEP